SAIVEEVVGPLPGEWTRDQKQRGLIIDDANPSRNLGIPGLIKNVSGGQSGGKQRSAHDLVPVEAQAGFYKKALGNKPAVLHVAAGFDIGCGRAGSAAEGGVAGAR